MLERLDETIVAVSSAPGSGIVGIVRLSGPDAIAIADRLAQLDAGARLANRPGSTRVEGHVCLDADAAVPATFYVFRAPRSYTRQDIVEIHTVGAPVVLELVRRGAVELGATPARPGEFTARAFLHGAMDLACAEAVAGIIRAQTDTQLRASWRMRDGTLTRRIRGLRDDLAQVVSLVEAGIDFAEEPIEFITPDALRGRLDGVLTELTGLTKRATSVERFDASPRILLFGPPNAGKSTLMNRLCGTDRAICAAAAGTTRDILSAPIRIGRGEAVLLDAAGVDAGGMDATGRRDAVADLVGSEDAVSAEARARAKSAAGHVDLICLVVDLTEPWPESVFEIVRSLDGGRVVVAANKCDRVSPGDAERRAAELRSDGWAPVVVVSALSGSGTDALRAAMAVELGSAVATVGGETILVTERQRAAMTDAMAAITRAITLSREARETIDNADVVAFELRDALDALGAVTGEVTTEDLLDRVFSTFCIGK